MGNPNAPVKLLEYGSFGCPHCGEFEAEAAEPLRDYIRSGRVSWEFRSLHIFPFDPAVSMLTRCHGPEAYFLLKQQLYASQPEWERKFQEWAEQPAVQSQIAQMLPQQRLKPLITAAGLDEFFRQRGMPQAKIDACLADTKGLERVFEISNRGSTEFNVTGTPAFFINGTAAKNAGRWSELEPLLKRALGD
jgi:protein-disulfide isomerase